MKHCGLLGRHLQHSFSPQIHQHLGSYIYELFEVEPDSLPEFLLHGVFDAINVTIPYKKAVIPFCAQLSPMARKLGSVNTILRQPDGSLTGHNTDYHGFSAMLQKSGLEVNGKKVLVLGSGGASVTAVAVLQELGARVVVVSRTGENNYNNLHLHRDAAVIVNATPVGMFPNNLETPLSLDIFTNAEGVLDMIYNPARTKLLMDAEKRGLVTQNGLWMLISQAAEGAKLFTGTCADKKNIAGLYQTLSAEAENIVLIGMPGCGKTTVGKLLAEKTGKTFVDADTVLEETTGKSIPHIFQTEGEPAFRKYETTVLKELGKRSGCVIATGGGCVTRDENYPILHQNSTIIYLQRRISDLATEGRPLSLSGNLQKMEALRKPLYEAFCDFSADNNSTPEETAGSILESLCQRRNIL